MCMCHVKRHEEVKSSLIKFISSIRSLIPYTSTCIFLYIVKTTFIIRNLSMDLKGACDNFVCKLL